MRDSTDAVGRRDVSSTFWIVKGYDMWAKPSNGGREHLAGIDGKETREQQNSSTSATFQQPHNTKRERKNAEQAQWERGGL